jgi:hypothetical protein
MFSNVDRLAFTAPSMDFEVMVEVFNTDPYKTPRQKIPRDAKELILKDIALQLSPEQRRVMRVINRHSASYVDQSNHCWTARARGAVEVEDEESLRLV